MGVVDCEGVIAAKDRGCPALLGALQRVAAVVFVVDMLVELVIPNAYSMVLLPVTQ